MRNSLKIATETLKMPLTGFVERHVDPITGFRSLLSRKSFMENDVISEFYWNVILKTPNYLTVQIGENQHIELLPSHLECANHSCDPNAFFDTTNRQLVCIRPIRKGDEITFFYPSAEWNMDRPFECNCKSSNCIIHVAGAKYLTKGQVARYRFTDFIKEKLHTVRK